MQEFYLSIEKVREPERQTAAEAATHHSGRRSGHKNLTDGSAPSDSMLWPLRSRPQKTDLGA